MVQSDLNQGETPVLHTSGTRDSGELGFTLLFAGSILFVSMLSVLFGFNLYVNFNHNLSQINPQSAAGAWLYGVEFSIGLILLLLTIIGMKNARLDIRIIRWSIFAFVLFAFATFIYILKWAFVGLFIDEFPIGAGMILMLIGSIWVLYRPFA